MASEPETTFAESRFGQGATLTEVAGDASTRRFYRVKSGDRAAILMAHGEALPEDAPLFSNHRILRTIGAPVPAILARDDRQGLVLVEDLGDVSLQKAVSTPGGRDSGADLYRQACDIIALLQRRGEGAVQPSDFAGRNALDKERFLFELDHFHRHFVLGLRGMKPDGSDETRLRLFYDEVAAACDRLPRVYCHRDFQSRNLMVKDGQLRVIDFQDARMGPYTYDAASLLRDSSLDLAEPLVEEMIERLNTSCALPLGIGPEEFRQDFDLMALQRNIKDLGTFGYMATARQRRDYLAYVPRTIGSIRRTLLGDRRWHDVYELVQRFVLTWTAPESAGR
jgi:aminoglycoside/choline kinase family phosphotransferase